LWNVVARMPAIEVDRQQIMFAQPRRCLRA
jgi:hypothetical protein